MARSRVSLGLLGLCGLVAGCSADAGGYDTAGFDTDSGVGTSDAATTSAGTDPTTGAPPEVEDEGDFRVPRASGKYVYTASETTDSVAVIDTATLAIDVVAVGQAPTVVQPVPGQSGEAGAAVVLDRGSDDVAVLRTSEAGVTTVALHAVTPGANNLAVAPDGEYVFVYHDIDGPEQLGPGSDQELTVLALADDAAYSMTVGAHPREVVFATDRSRAWVVTAAGVNVIEFAALAAIGKPPLLPVTDDPGIDPDTLEVQVVASEGLALARVDGAAVITVTDLASGERTVVDLPASPTDLDIAPNGEFAVLTLPGLGGSSFLELPLPLVGGGQFTEHAVAGEYVGQSAVGHTGDVVLLFTTVDPFPHTAGPPEDRRASEDDPMFASTGSSGSSGSSSSGGSSDTGDVGTTGADTGDAPHVDPRQRITLARRDGPGWDLVTQFVEIPVASVGVAPDSRNAILVHAEDPGNAAAKWSYSLIDLVPAFPLLKRQTTAAPPGPVLFTPDGGRAAVLLREDAAQVKKVDLVDLATFIVDPLPLGSPPEGAGYVDATAKIFVSQEHPTGRITFVGPTGDVQTVTGYVLNDSVKD